MSGRESLRSNTPAPTPKLPAGTELLAVGTYETTDGCPSRGTFRRDGHTFDQFCVRDRGHAGAHVNTSSRRRGASLLTWNDPAPAAAPTPKLTPAQRRLLEAAAGAKSGRAHIYPGAGSRVAARLEVLGLGEFVSAYAGFDFAINAAGRAAIARKP